MKKTSKKITAMLNAITFAESGDHETAIEFAEDSARLRSTSTEQAYQSQSKFSSMMNDSIDRTMSAVSFAEENLHQQARNLMTGIGAKTILLVIEGEFPRQSAFSYACKLCERTNAQMDILQIIPPPYGPESYQILAQRMSTAVTNLVHLLQKDDRLSAMPKLTIRLGEIDSKLLNYVKRHKEVSVVVLDSTKDMTKRPDLNKQSDFFKSLSRKLAVPLMTVLDRVSVEAIV